MIARRELQSKTRADTPTAGARSTSSRIARLNSAIGNRALARLAARPRLQLMRTPRTLSVDGETVTWDDEEYPFVNEGAIRSVLGELSSFGEKVKLNSRFVAGRLKAKHPAHAGEILVGDWRFGDLVGLLEALKVAAAARGVVLTTSGVQTDPGVTSGAVNEAMSWTFGINTGAAPTDQGETMVDQQRTVTDRPPSVAAIGMTDTCFNKVPEDVEGWLEPISPGQHWDPNELIREVSTPQQRFEHEWRMARLVWVHEIGHTIYAAFDATTAATWIRVARWELGSTSEAPPTRYAREGNPRIEEDFCESFALFALYPDKLRQRCPLRWQWFKQREAFFGLRPPAPHTGPFVADPHARWGTTSAAQYLPPMEHSRTPTTAGAEKT